MVKPFTFFDVTSHNSITYAMFLEMLYVLKGYALWRDLGSNPGLFDTNTKDWSSGPKSLLVTGKNNLLKFLIPSGIEP